ncbi:MAG: ABC transporter permease [Hyphomicrobiales bacterium]|jgi:NitT/TauT family transport system permease protein|nr:ABC transporter permease [Hyphomicrobiales bacterium]
MSRTNILRLAPYVFTIAFFVLWEVACRALKVSTFVLPPPSAIWAAMVQFQGPLWRNALHTLWMTSAGFGLSVVFGILLGLIVGSSRVLYAGLNPLLVGFNSIPKVAVVPILVIWFGVGWLPPVLTAFVISFFPIVVNMATGLATIEPETEDVMKALGANRLDIMWKVGIPRSLPYLFGALKVSITLAYVGSVIGEQNASNVGLGNLITRASADFNVPLIFAALIVLAILGVFLVVIVDLVEARTTKWARRSQLANA